MSVNVDQKQVIASEDVVVHDDNIDIDRQLFAGQPVPPDLVDAYKEATGKGSRSSSSSASEPGGGGDQAPDYSKQNNADLEAEIKNRGLEVPTEGTGQDGKVIKKDLVAVLEKHDAESGGGE